MANVGLIDLVRRVAAGEALTDELKGRIRATIKTASTPALVDVYKKLRSVCKPDDTFKLPPNCLWIKQEICQKVEKKSCDAEGRPTPHRSPSAPENADAYTVGPNRGFSMPGFEAMVDDTGSSTAAADLEGTTGPVGKHPDMHNEQREPKPTSR